MTVHIGSYTTYTDKLQKLLSESQHECELLREQIAIDQEFLKQCRKEVASLKIALADFAIKSGVVLTK